MYMRSASVHVLAASLWLRLCGIWAVCVGLCVPGGFDAHLARGRERRRFETHEVLAHLVRAREYPCE